MATHYGPCPSCIAKGKATSPAGDARCFSPAGDAWCLAVVVPAGRICFDCAFRTPQEREQENERLRAQLYSPWRRFPLESLGLLAAAVWSACVAVKARDTLSLIGSAMIASVGLRWVRTWLFSLGVAFALTACGGEAFHAGLDEGGSGGSAVLAGNGGSGDGSTAGTNLSGGAVGAAGTPSSAAGTGGATARGGAGGATTATGGAGGSAAGASGGIAGSVGNAGAAGKGECVAGWEGSSCDACSSAGETCAPGQLNCCAAILDCYAAHHCGPGCAACEGDVATSDASAKLAREVYACRCP